MARIMWDNVGERYYETGVDRGVLYVGNSAVAWPGLISVNETPSGGEPRPYYLDGVKYLNLASSEEFEATINAFAAPKEFGPCDGTMAVQNGLFATQQPRKAFNLCYRTLIGNDTEGKKRGYKIHLVYNALAGPSERNNATLGQDVEPNTYTWAITTLPPSLTGMKPTAHFVVDSRYTPKGLLAYLEGVLYGTPEAAPRIPSASELIDLFNSPGPVTFENLVNNPSAENNLNEIGVGFAPATIIRDTSKAVFGASSVKATATGTDGISILWTVATMEGRTYSFAVWAYVPTGTNDIRADAYLISSTAPYDSKDNWVKVTHTFTATGATSYVGISTSGTVDIGDVLWADAMIVVEGDTVPDYFDGDSVDTDDAVYSWVGTPHASHSIVRSLV